MSIDPVFFEVFRLWFDLDLGAPDLEARLKDDADICAASLYERGADLNALIRDLLKFLHEWDPETLGQLRQVSYIDWLFDAQTENLLRRIISEIVEGLQYYAATDASRDVK